MFPVFKQIVTQLTKFQKNILVNYIKVKIMKKHYNVMKLIRYYN